MNNSKIILTFLIVLVVFNFKLTAQEAMLKVQAGHSSTINILKFSDNSNLLASIDDKNNIIIWQVAVGREMIRFTDNSEIKTCLFGNNATELYTGNINGELKNWNINGSGLIRSIKFPSPINDIIFSENEKSLYVASEKIYKVNAESFDTTVVLNLRAIDIHFNKNENCYYFTTNIGDVVVYDGKEQTGEFVATREGKRRKMLKKNMKLDIKYLEKKSEYEAFIKAYNGPRETTDTATLYQTNPFMSLEKQVLLGEELMSTIPYNMKLAMSRYQEKKYSIKFPSYTNEGMIIYAWLSKIYAFNFSKKRMKYNISNFYYDVPFSSLSLATGKNLLIAGTEDARLYVHNLKTGKKLKLITDHLSNINAIAVSSDESIFATAGKDRSIIIWNSETLKQEKRLYSRAFPITCLDAANNEVSVVFGNNHGDVKTIDLESPGMQLESFKNHTHQVSAVKYFPDDNKFASAGLDNKVLIRNLINNEESVRVKFWRNLRLKPEINPIVRNPKIYVRDIRKVTSLDISFDGGMLAAGGKNEWISNINRKIPVKLYNTDNFSLHNKIKTLSMDVTSLSFHPDSYNFLAGNSRRITDWKIDDKNAFIQTDIRKTDTIFPKLVWMLKFIDVSTINWIDNSTFVFNTDSSLIKYNISNKETKRFTENDIIDHFVYHPEKEMYVIAVNNDIKLIDANLFLEMNVLKGHSDTITGLSFFKGTDLIASSSLDGTIKIWDINKSELICTMVPVDRNKLVIFTPDNYYMASKQSLDGIGFKYGNRFFPPEQFDLKFNRPDIILERLGFASEELIDAYKRAYNKRLSKMGFKVEDLGDDFHLPKAKIRNFEYLDIKDTAKVLLDLSFNDTKYNLDKINIWINDVPVFGSAGISIKDKNVKEHDKKLKLNLAYGKNKIQVSVYNSKGVESLKETVVVFNKAEPKKPELYMVTIGASLFKDSRFNLEFAAKDANDVEKLFLENKSYSKIHIKSLTDSMVTKENIIALKSFFYEAKIDDVVMLFIAGHGLLDKKLDYYYATHDIDFHNPGDMGIEYSDIEALLDGLKALKKVLFMDTCHSGELDTEEDEDLADNSEPENDTEEGSVTSRNVGAGIRSGIGVQNSFAIMKELFTDLRRGTGSTIVSSAGGAEFALESAAWKNGLFTYCLLNGIRSMKADLDKNNEIKLSELRTYVRNEVSRLSRGRQQPTSRTENITMDFIVW